MPVLGSNFPDGQGHEILGITKNFFEQTEPGETLVFYFSGHGIVYSGEVYLAIPETDSKSPLFHSLNLSDLTRLINNCRSTRIVGIIDACDSGVQAYPSQIAERSTKILPSPKLPKQSPFMIK